jgi:hypothetical protein
LQRGAQKRLICLRKAALGNEKARGERGLFEIKV